MTTTTKQIDYESRATGHTALTRACALGRLETAETLLDRGANINRLPKRRLATPLHQGSPRRQILTPAGASSLALPSLREAAQGGGAGRQPPPPLIAAAAVGHAAMVRMLLERGADPDIRDGNGKTAADVAKSGAFVDVLGELARVRIVESWAA